MTHPLTTEQQKIFEKTLKKIESQSNRGNELTSLAARSGFIESRTESWLKKFITEDPEMISMKDLVRKLAPLNYPVLILGETGTGKELIAQALHGNRTGEFRGINLTTLTELLIESELFGHTKGSFTGAIDDKKGLLEFCHNGTIFLDEIGDMPMTAQVKLLRAIQEMRIRPVGSNEERPITCRFVFATHRSLETLVESGKFRQDLFYRISVCEVKTSPLRERSSDIPEIIDSWCLELGVNTFPQQVIDHWLNGYKWEGNVRELYNVFIRHCINNNLI